MDAGLEITSLLSLVSLCPWLAATKIEWDSLQLNTQSTPRFPHSRKNLTGSDSCMLCFKSIKLWTAINIPLFLAANNIFKNLSTYFRLHTKPWATLIPCESAIIMNFPGVLIPWLYFFTSNINMKMQAWLLYKEWANLSLNWLLSQKLSRRTSQFTVLLASVFHVFPSGALFMNLSRTIKEEIIQANIFIAFSILQNVFLLKLFCFILYELQWNNMIFS